MTRLRTAVIGCVRFSQSMLEELLTIDSVEVRAVVTSEQSAFNADFCNLARTAAPRDIPVFQAQGNDQTALAPWLKSHDIDVMFCLGWPFLLKQEVRAAASVCVGYHPTLLPRNRGRHPIIWALALGLSETGSTFFVLDDGADSGPILSQERVLIAGDDDAERLYARLEVTARKQIRGLAEGLRIGAAKPVPQDDARATYWRKRGKVDGRIDWRMPADGIHNLVRALARPYVGAHVEHRGLDVKIWKVEVGPGGVADVEPGFVLGGEGDTFHVQCGAGSTLYVRKHEFIQCPARGDYL